MAVLDRRGAVLDTSKGPLFDDDDSIFSRLPPNYENNDSSFRVRSVNIDAPPPCYTTENEYVVYKILFAFYKELNIPFATIVESMQTHSESKINSIAVVKDNLIRLVPNMRTQIEMKYQEIANNKRQLSLSRFTGLNLRIRWLDILWWFPCLEMIF